MEGEYVIEDGGTSAQMQIFRCYAFVVVMVAFGANPGFYSSGLGFAFFLGFAAFWILLFWLTEWSTPCSNAAIFSDELTIQGKELLQQRSIRLTKDQLRSINGYETRAVTFFGLAGLRETFDGQSKWLGFIGSGSGQTLAITTDNIRIIISCKNAVNTAKTLRRVFEVQPMEVKLPPSWKEYRRNKEKYLPSE